MPFTKEARPFTSKEEQSALVISRDSCPVHLHSVALLTTCFRKFSWKHFGGMKFVGKYCNLGQESTFEGLTGSTQSFFLRGRQSMHQNREKRLFFNFAKIVKIVSGRVKTGKKTVLNR